MPIAVSNPQQGPISVENETGKQSDVAAMPSFSRVDARQAIANEFASMAKGASQGVQGTGKISDLASLKAVTSSVDSKDPYFQLLNAKEDALRAFTALGGEKIFDIKNGQLHLEIPKGYTVDLMNRVPMTQNSQHTRTSVDIHSQDISMQADLSAASIPFSIEGSTGSLEMGAVVMRRDRLSNAFKLYEIVFFQEDGKISRPTMTEHGTPSLSGSHIFIERDPLTYGHPPTGFTLDQDGPYHRILFSIRNATDEQINFVKDAIRPVLNIPSHMPHIETRIHGMADGSTSRMTGAIKIHSSTGGIPCHVPFSIDQNKNGAVSATFASGKINLRSIQKDSEVILSHAKSLEQDGHRVVFAGYSTDGKPIVVTREANYAGFSFYLADPNKITPVPIKNLEQIFKSNSGSQLKYTYAPANKAYAIHLSIFDATKSSSDASLTIK
jgi:hypothetical protein